MTGASDEVKETVKDILDGRREFTVQGLEEGSDELTYFIASPSGQDIRKADWQYSKIYNQAMTDGFLTQSQMFDLLKDKEIISDNYNRRVESAKITLAAELYKLEELHDEDDDFILSKEITAMEVARLRDDLFQLNHRVNGPMANTCENLAEDARTDFITSRIIEKKDNSKLWEDFDEYKQEENTTLAVQARFEVMLWMQGLTSDFLNNTPEQVALREISQLKMDRAIAAAAEEEDVTKKAEIIVKELSPAGVDIDLSSIEDKKPGKETVKKKSPAKRKSGRPKGSKSKKKSPKKT